MEILYFQQASKAFEAKEYRKCLAFLFNLKVWRKDAVNLLVVSSYNHWKSCKDDKSTVNYEDAIAFAHASFTRLLDGNIPFHLISPKDYLLLTHIYLSEGNLHDALMIMNLASARGYLEDIFIVAQTFLILKRIGKSSDIQRYHQFMVSELLIIASTLKPQQQYPDRLDRIAMSGVFLFCANQLRIQIGADLSSTSDKVLLLRTFCSAAYLLTQGDRIDDWDILLKWFKDTSTWASIGCALKDGPFILLAEECFWIGFCKIPLDETFIAMVYDCMVETKRNDKIYSLLSVAYSISPWNIFVRQKLYEISSHESVVNGNEWIVLMNAQMVHIITIQRLFRGYSLRRKWFKVSKYLRELRDDFFAKIEISETMFKQYFVRLKRNIFYLWKVNARRRRVLTLFAVIKMQSFFRAYRARFTYVKKRRMVARANGQFLTALFMRESRVRLKYFRKWFDVYFQIRKKNAAFLIADVLLANGYNQLLVQGMGIILALLRIHKAHELKRRFKLWILRYNAAVRRHAIATIRFFVRNKLLSAAEKALEEQLSILEADISIRRTTDEYRSNFLPLLREMWKRWDFLYKQLVNLRKRHRMVQCLQSRFRCRRSKLLLKAAITRKECQSSYLFFHRRKKLSFTFLVWRTLRSSLVIQRSYRCYVSRKIFNIRYIRSQRVEYHLAKRRAEIKLDTFKRWIVYLYICRKDLSLYRKLLKNSFNRWDHLRNLGIIHKRKRYAVKLIISVHMAFLRFAFRLFASACRSERQFISVTKISLVLTRFKTKSAFQLLRKHCAAQTLLRKRMVRIFGGEYPLKFLTCSMVCKADVFKLWHRLQLNLIDVRVRAAMILSRTLLEQIGRILSFRRLCIVKIQAAFRGGRGRNVAAVWRNRVRHFEEIMLLIQRKQAYALWFKLKATIANRIKAKLLINHFLWNVMYRLRTSKLVDVENKMLVNYAKVAISLVFHRSTVMKAFRAFQLALLLKPFRNEVQQPFKELANVRRIEPTSEKKYSRTKLTRSDISISNHEFHNELFHATLTSTLRTSCLLYDGTLKISHNELSYCVWNAQSLFISCLDIPIVAAASRHFRGAKIVFHDCPMGKLLISFVASLLEDGPADCRLLEGTSVCSRVEGSPKRGLSLHFVNTNPHPIIFFGLGSQLGHMCNNLSLFRFIEEIEFTTSSTGYFGTMRLLFSMQVGL